MRGAWPVVILACGVLAAGCGNSRTPVPNLTRPAAPGGFRTLRFPSAGVSFTSPRSWPSIAQRAPLVTVVASGNAVIVLKEYAPPALLTRLRYAVFAPVRRSLALLPAAA